MLSGVEFGNYIDTSSVTLLRGVESIVEIRIQKEKMYFIDIRGLIYELGLEINWIEGNRRSVVFVKPSKWFEDPEFPSVDKDGYFIGGSEFEISPEIHFIQETSSFLIDDRGHIHQLAETDSSVSGQSSSLYSV